MVKACRNTTAVFHAVSQVEARSQDNLASEILAVVPGKIDSRANIDVKYKISGQMKIMAGCEPSVIGAVRVARNSH